VVGIALNPQSSERDFWNFCFDDHVHSDVPAIIAAVKAKTGVARVHWVGHSMGGMVVLAGAGFGITSELASLTCLGSPSRFEWSVARTKLLAFLGSSAGWRRVPLPRMGRFAFLAALLVQWISWRGPLNGRNVRLRDLLRGFVNIPNYVSIGLMRQVRSWMQTKLFIDRRGHDYLENYGQGACPALFFAGTVDSVADPRSVYIGYERWGHADKKYLELGRAAGHKRDYGHTDLAIGERIQTEVFPDIVQWIDKYDH
jgi:pimeloyl-ACP methyl ester carboxylesterase